MTILKTYARLWADDLDATLPTLRALVGSEPDLRFAFEGVELAAIGDFLVIAGLPEQRAKYAGASATVIVSDLDGLVRTVCERGGEITTPVSPSATGRFCYIRHPGGAELEYVEWSSDLVRAILTPIASLSG